MTPQLRTVPSSYYAPNLFEDAFNTYGLRQYIFSYLSIETLHITRRVNANLRTYADDELNERSFRITDKDVASGMHVSKLRNLIHKAEAGQTIHLAGGEYLLGDETVDGHAHETIRLDNDEDSSDSMSSYECDFPWNGWKHGYGPFSFHTPGLKLIGTMSSSLSTPLSSSLPKKRRRFPPPTSATSSTPAVRFVFHANSKWCMDYVALQIYTRGITLQNIHIKGGSTCEAINIGFESLYAPGQIGVNVGNDVENAVENVEDSAKEILSCSATLRGCRIEGCVFVGEHSRATLRDCIICHAPLGVGKAGVAVDYKGVLSMEQTVITNCGEQENQHRRPVLATGGGCSIVNKISSSFLRQQRQHQLLSAEFSEYGGGGLWMEMGSRVIVNQVSIQGNAPSDISVRGLSRINPERAKQCEYDDTELILSGDLYITRPKQWEQRKCGRRIVTNSRRNVGLCQVESDGSLIIPSNIRSGMKVRICYGATRDGSNPIHNVRLSPISKKTMGTVKCYEKRMKHVHHESEYPWKGASVAVSKLSISRHKVGLQSTVLFDELERQRMIEFPFVL